MKKALHGNKTQRLVKTALDMFLRVEASSASCIFAFQPKSPEGLKKFRKN